jgi:histidinol dehydrogenase
MIQLIDLQGKIGKAPLEKLGVFRTIIDTSVLEETVGRILSEVKANGDEAVRKFTLKFDKAIVNDLLVSEEEIDSADKILNNDLKDAMLTAKKNIEKFHFPQLQKHEVIETMPGVQCWRKNVAIEKVGLYIPGGTAPLFSTILMLAIPAKIAGCKEIILCSPPDTQGNLHPAILYATRLVGITKIYRVGGVQAIGAMTWGTETIPKVNKIFGPGNQYVMHAKQMVQKEGIAIDLPAGPSEVAVYADKTADASFVAADILSQAEHGVDSQAILVCSPGFLVSVCVEELKKQIEQLPRKDIARRALENSRIIFVKDEDEAINLLNEYAPEHLILACDNAETLAHKVINAGSVFIGHFTPESVGDYASGTNHTLPTNGYAKSYSGVSVDSFVKKITYQKLSEEGLTNIAGIVETMANAEGLEGHKNAVSIRMNRLDEKAQGSARYNKVE